MANNLFFLLAASLLCIMSILAAAGASGTMNEAAATSPGACKSRVEIFGYKCEEHTVTTEDGYILSIQRIPDGHSGAAKGENKIPVLLQHGVLTDGIIWLINSPQESLGYILADNGFDVWVANSRGTVYSRRHASLAPPDPAYWEWSWDELVAYDLPATLEYIYHRTGQQRLHYVGHSLGTLIALASFCEHKLLNMIRSAALLSPIAYLDHVGSPVARGATDLFAAEALYWLGVHEFNPTGKEVHKLLKRICEEPNVNCYDLITAITGKNCCLNSSTIQVFLDHEPQPTSTKNAIHLSQMMRRGTISKYDYDDYDENMKHYGQPDPPAYDMSSIPNNLSLFLSYGGEDTLSDAMDVEYLLDRLKFHDTDKLTVQYASDYAHGDFVMATNAKQVVYDSLITFFKNQ